MLKFDFSKQWVNLASAKLGAKAMACSDDFFAPMSRMLNDAPPVFIEDKYDDHGKWMDGWESRRKRIPGNDWCIVKLARPGIVHGIELETTYFTGNYPPAASIDGCNYDGDLPDDDCDWAELVPKSVLDGDSQYQYAVNCDETFTHIRITIYPDGGIARLKVYGQPNVDWDAIPRGKLVDVAASVNGGVALIANNEHYGSIHYLLTPGRGINMGDGWETRRRREPGNDWVIIALAKPSRVNEIHIDTAHYKGNYPEGCNILAANLKSVDVDCLQKQSENWDELMSKVALQADHEHTFIDEVNHEVEVTHLRVNIYPDGGLSRVRVMTMVNPI